jgi:hypothetical protein
MVERGCLRERGSSGNASSTPAVCAGRVAGFLLTWSAPPHPSSGESRYHALYGTLSTAALASIVYGYFRRARNAPPLQWAGAVPPAWRLAAGCLLQAVGFAGLAPS